jgi:hypothetical protein
MVNLDKKNYRALRVGDWIEVRSKEEILATLDKDGRLEGMPFMPEMFAYCGKRFRVFKRAHKGCDTIFPVRSRRFKQCIHLETRCNGEGHDGCQAGCLIYWKEAWLKRVADDSPPSRLTEIPVKPPSACTETDVFRAARRGANDAEPVTSYMCQVTELPAASEDLSPWDIRQYIEDYTSGNVRLGQWLRGVIYISYQNLMCLGIGWGPLLRWLYERFQRLTGGLPHPNRRGKIPLRAETPTGYLNLQEGELVRVKSYEAIMATLNVANKNRGMLWDGEMMPYCGSTYRVKKRVTRIIHEETGKMVEMKNPCIILEDVVCQARYSSCRLFCPRAIYPYWREIWLERVNAPHQSQQNPQGSQPDMAAKNVLLF